MNKYLPFLLFVLFIPLSSGGAGNQTNLMNHSDTGVTKLSLNLRKLFSQEMQHLQKGMKEILVLYIAGKWSEIAPIAKAIEESYVLKKHLSKKQMHELHTKLPKEFITLDQHFHYLAGMLKRVAKNKNPELIGFYFYKMNESCVNCHAKFATHKFPAFMQKIKVHSH